MEDDQAVGKLGTGRFTKEVVMVANLTPATVKNGRFLKLGGSVKHVPEVRLLSSANAAGVGYFVRCNASSTKINGSLV